MQKKIGDDFEECACYVSLEPFFEHGIHDGKCEPASIKIEKGFVCLRMDDDVYLPRVCMREKTPGKLYIIKNDHSVITLLNYQVVKQQYNLTTSTYIRSDVYTIGSHNSRHFEMTDKIESIEYLRNDLPRKFDNSTVQIETEVKDNVLKAVEVKAGDIETVELGEAEFPSKAGIVLENDYYFSVDYHSNECKLLSKTEIIIKFRDAISFEEVPKIVSQLEAALYLYTGNKFRQNCYYVKRTDDPFNSLVHKTYSIGNNSAENMNDNNVFISFDRTVFIQILSCVTHYYQISANCLFPIINYDHTQPMEEKFLAYYRMLETIIRSKGEKQEKYIPDLIRRHTQDLTKTSVNTLITDPKKLSLTLYALRCKYVHEGYYQETVEIKNDENTETIPITGPWLFSITKVLKMLAILELFDYQNIKVDQQYLEKI